MMWWVFNRKASASNEAMAQVMEQVERAQEQVRDKRLALERVISEMKEDRKHARSE